MDGILRDEKGAPLVLYHGGTAGIEMFRPLSHFGTLQAAHDRLTAGAYLDMSDSEPTLPGAVVYPVHLRMKNPLEMEDVGNFSAVTIAWRVETAFPQQAGLTRRVMQAVAENEKSASLSHYARSCDLAGLIPGGRSWTPASRQVAEGISPHALVEGLWSRFDIGRNGPDALVRQCFPYETSSEHGRPLQLVARALAACGHDGISYTNTWEDKGTRSFIILRSDQVVPAVGQVRGRTAREPERSAMMR